MITTTIETITPERAQAYLAQNVRNRVINSRSVDALVRDIKAGSFYLTHQGIAFYDDGTLADGQHRLTAIVLAGRPVQMMVTRCLPHDTKIAIDYGEKRRFEDADRSSATRRSPPRSGPCSASDTIRRTCSPITRSGPCSRAWRRKSESCIALRSPGPIPRLPW